MKLWKDDAELFSIAKKELFPALVGDILDKMGYIHQFISPQIKPLRNDMVVVGRAMPVLEADVFAEKLLFAECFIENYKSKWAFIGI